MNLRFARLLVVLLPVVAAPFAAGVPLPFKVPTKVADAQTSLEPDQINLQGFLGARIVANEHNRLLAVDENRLLEGFRKRPGRQTWDGEHVGKWLHAATLAWVNTGDPAMRTKLDLVVRELLKCQLEDGYLGTYLPEKRWTSWDVWAHKYDLIGLITYMRYTGDTAPLDACRRIGDLLCRELGDRPGQRSILEGSPHFGMAHTSVLEPMVWLYRTTGDEKYLEFCRMILRAWDGPNGPRVVSDLVAGKGVHQVANAKAYEMMSCINGALELYRVTGDAKLLQAARNAWQDIVAKRLYITGTASHHEHFHADYELPNALQNVGETCVTVTWVQLNAHLLRITGEPAFAEELERTCYNHLLGAQQPDGCGWSYYVELEGVRKPHSQDLSGHCCLSSGPRGIALIPTFAAGVDRDGAVINFYEQGEAKLALADGRHVTLKVDTGFPLSDSVRITVTAVERPGEFALKLRIPQWTRGAEVNAAGAAVATQPGAYTTVKRAWQAGDVVQVRIPLRPRLVMGTHGNAGTAAVLYGPLVLAADDRVNPDAKIGSFQLFHQEIGKLDFAALASGESEALLKGAPVFKVNAATVPEVPKAPRKQNVPLRLVTYADAGFGAPFKVWLPVWMYTTPPEATLGAPKMPTD